MSSLEPDRPLKKRSVVSGFIFRYPEGDNAEDAKPQVALFQRSNKVRTYQHHLAPISGTIEATDRTPSAAAWREIAEETGLTPRSLVMMRQGKPFTFSDTRIGREWTVHPFAFRLRSSAEERHIKIDWEHEAWAWHDPTSVFGDTSIRGVPRLLESLRRVYFEADLGDSAGITLRRGLERLRSDHQSGARKLATEALEVLRDAVAGLQTDAMPSGVWWRYVRIVAWHVWKNGRESMGAAILNQLLSTLKAVEEACGGQGLNLESGAETCHAVVLETINARIRTRNADFATRAVSDALQEYAEGVFRDRLAEGTPVSVLTLSESETIRKAIGDLMRRAEFTLDIRVLESRPLFEGASLAGKLAEVARVARSTLPTYLDSSQNHISIWSDASAALASKDLDIVVIGADRISSSGDVSNKTGSVPAILSAKHASPSALVVVLSETEKVAPPESPKAHVVEDNDPTQLTRAWKADYNSEAVRRTARQLSPTRSNDPELGSDWSRGTDAQVSVRNIFFEWIPSRLIDAYITERGRWTNSNIVEHSRSLAAEEVRLFGDLADPWP